MFNRLCITAGTFGLALILLFGHDFATYLASDAATVPSSEAVFADSNSTANEQEMTRFHELAHRLSSELRERMVANTRERIEIRELKERNEPRDVIHLRIEQLNAAEEQLEWIAESKNQLIQQLANLANETNETELSRVRDLAQEIETQLSSSHHATQTTTALHFMEEVVPVAVSVSDQTLAENYPNPSPIGLVETLSARE